MNRSLQAFAVLLVSLAGSMVAIVWSPAGTGLKSTLAVQNGPVASPTRLASVSENAEKLPSVLVVRPKTITVRPYEDSCGYDQVTGKHYAAAEIPVAQQNPAIVAEYAAAQRAAAGLSPVVGTDNRWLSQKLTQAAKNLILTVQPQSNQSWSAQLNQVVQQTQTLAEERLQTWGISRIWQRHLAKTKYLNDRPALPGDQELAAWLPDFNVPTPATRSVETTRPLLSLAASALDSLAGILHHTAADLNRLAMQDVAKLHTATQPQDAKR